MNFLWYFNSDFDNFFVDLLNSVYSFDNLFNWHDFLNDLFNNFFDFMIEVLDHLYFNNSFLDYWYLNYLLDLDDDCLFNDSVDYFFNDLWDFNNLLDDSWNNNNFFNDFLDLNNLGYFDHLFNDFINMDSDFFNSFDGSWDLYDLFDDDSDWVALSNVVVDWLFNFDDFVDFNNLINVPIDFDDPWNFDLLYDDLSDNFRYSYNSFHNEGYFNSLLNDVFDFLNQMNGVVNNFLDFFNSVYVDNLLFDHSDLSDCGNLNMDLDDLFNNLDNFHNSFVVLDDWNRLFDDHFNDFGVSFYVVHDFSGWKMLDNSDDLFSNHFNFGDLRYVY